MGQGGGFLQRSVRDDVFTGKPPVAYGGGMRAFVAKSSPADGLENCDHFSKVIRDVRM